MKIPNWVLKIDNTISKIIDVAAILLFVAGIIFCIAYVNIWYQKEIVKEAIEEVKQK